MLYFLIAQKIHCNTYFIAVFGAPFYAYLMGNSIFSISDTCLNTKVLLQNIYYETSSQLHNIPQYTSYLSICMITVKWNISNNGQNKIILLWDVPSKILHHSQYDGPFLKITLMIKPNFDWKLKIHK